jgi:carbohydrate-selective porin OprB
MFVNNPAIDFPDNGAGIRAGYAPREWIELGYGVFDSDSDWEKLGDNLFNIGEINLKPRFFGREGNYRFIAWHNDANHTKWLSVEQDKESNYGFALSFDQKVSDIITLFCRYGWQNPRVYNPENTTAADLSYSLNQAWSMGVQFEGKPWGRNADVLAFAVGENIPSSDYRQAGAGLEPARLAKREGHLEAYYKIQINKYLSLSPDLQYIWNPFGRDVSDDTAGIFVYGFRTQIDF